MIIAVDETANVSMPLGVLALVLSTLALVAVASMWRRNRRTPVTAAEPTMELRDETPALVDLVTGGFDVDHDAMPATVVDLAARGHFSIDQIATSTMLRVRRHGGGDREVTAYERRVVDHVAAKAIDGVVPANVLTLGDHGVSNRWFRSFRKEVTAHAHDLGLCTPRWSRGQRAVLGLSAVAAFLGPALIVRAGAEPASAGYGNAGNVLVGFAFAVAVATLVSTWRLLANEPQLGTAVGREAAAHWLGVREYYRRYGSFPDRDAAAVAIWDRHLANAVAMGLAADVERQLPFAPEDAHHAWSDVTGDWRKVTISYWGLPFRTRHPIWIVLTGLVTSILGAMVMRWGLRGARIDGIDGTDIGRSLSLTYTVIAVVAGVAALYGLVEVVVGAIGAMRSSTVEGVVLRKRGVGDGLGRIVTLTEWGRSLAHRLHLGVVLGAGDRLADDGFVAVDDGTADHLRAYWAGSSSFGDIHQGAPVRLTVRRFLGSVVDVEVLGRPTATDAVGD